MYNKSNILKKIDIKLLLCFSLLVQTACSPVTFSSVNKSPNTANQENTTITKKEEVMLSDGLVQKIERISLSNSSYELKKQILKDLYYEALKEGKERNFIAGKDFLTVLKNVYTQSSFLKEGSIAETQAQDEVQSLQKKNSETLNKLQAGHSLLFTNDYIRMTLMADQDSHEATPEQFGFGQLMSEVVFATHQQQLDFTVYQMQESAVSSIQEAVITLYNQGDKDVKSLIAAQDELKKDSKNKRNVQNYKDILDRVSKDLMSDSIDSSNIEIDQEAVKASFREALRLSSEKVHEILSKGDLVKKDIANVQKKVEHCQKALSFAILLVQKNSKNRTAFMESAVSAGQSLIAFGDKINELGRDISRKIDKASDPFEKMDDAVQTFFGGKKAVEKKLTETPKQRSESEKISSTTDNESPIEKDDFQKAREGIKTMTKNADGYLNTASEVLEIAKTLGVDEEIVKPISDAVKGAQVAVKLMGDIATGNYLGAAMSIMGLGGGGDAASANHAAIMAQFDKMDKKLNEIIKLQKQTLEKLQEMQKQMNDIYLALNKQLDTVHSDLIYNRQMIRELQDANFVQCDTLIKELVSTEDRTPIYKFSLNDAIQRIGGAHLESIKQCQLGLLQLASGAESRSYFQVRSYESSTGSMQDMVYLQNKLFAPLYNATINHFGLNTSASELSNRVAIVSMLNPVLDITGARIKQQTINEFVLNSDFNNGFQFIGKEENFGAFKLVETFNMLHPPSIKKVAKSGLESLVFLPLAEMSQVGNLNETTADDQFENFVMAAERAKNSQDYVIRNLVRMLNIAITQQVIFSGETILDDLFRDHFSIFKTSVVEEIPCSESVDSQLKLTDLQKLLTGNCFILGNPLLKKNFLNYSIRKSLENSGFMTSAYVDLIRKWKNTKVQIERDQYFLELGYLLPDFTFRVDPNNNDELQVSMGKYRFNAEGNAEIWENIPQGGEINMGLIYYPTELNELITLRKSILRVYVEQKQYSEASKSTQVFLLNHL